MSVHEEQKGQCHSMSVHEEQKGQCHSMSVHEEQKGQEGSREQQRAGKEGRPGRRGGCWSIAPLLYLGLDASGLWALNSGYTSVSGRGAPTANVSPATAHC